MTPWALEGFNQFLALFDFGAGFVESFYDGVGVTSIQQRQGRVNYDGKLFGVAKLVLVALAFEVRRVIECGPLLLDSRLNFSVDGIRQRSGGQKNFLV